MSNLTGLRGESLSMPWMSISAVLAMRLHWIIPRYTMKHPYQITS